MNPHPLTKAHDQRRSYVVKTVIYFTFMGLNVIALLAMVAIGIRHFTGA